MSTGDGGAAIGTILAVIAVAFLIVAAIAGFFLWMGAKFARIEGATFGRSAIAAVASALASSVIGVVLALAGHAGAGGLAGILVTIVVIQVIFKTTFVRALICWVGYLVSVLIGVFLAGFLVGLFGPSAKIIAARVSLAEIGGGLEKYRKDVGQFPTTEQGLRSLVASPAAPPKPKAWKGPYVMGGERLLMDPWDRAWIYRGPAQPAAPYALRSAGPDGQDGNGDDIAP